MQNNDRVLEQILDESIASYSEGAPLAGMEERILARIRLAETPSSGITGWRVAFGAGLAAIVIGAFFFSLERREEPRLTNLALATKRVEAIPIQIAVPQIVVKARHRITRMTALPKKPVFPTPTPLTAEERRLLALIKQDPEGTALAFNSLRRKSDEPIVIPPLESDDGQ